MSRRMLASASMAMWVVAIGLSVAAVWLGVLNRLDWQAAFGDFLPGLVLDALTFSTVGALIVLRRPGQPIGWLLCITGIGAGLAAMVGEYARYGLLTQPGAVSGATLAAWFESWGWILLFGLPVELLVLLFPTDRLLSPAWRPLVWLTVGLLIAAAGLQAFASAGASSLPFARNPLGVEPLSMDATRLTPLLLLPALVVMVVSGIARSDAVLLLDGILGALAFPSLAIAIAIAILRHRLYDIDGLINRTLVYGLLTVGLGATYWLCVVLLQTLLRPFTSGSDLAIVGSTLAVAALFQPVRRRIQLAVDRRFYRARYDAARTVESFSARLRDEIDLDSLGSELLSAVRATIQPTHVSLWLRSVK